MNKIKIWFKIIISWFIDKKYPKRFQIITIKTPEKLIEAKIYFHGLTYWEAMTKRVDC